jgi:hypothetical protein
VDITIANIRKGSSVLTELESNGTIKMAGAMYNLYTGVVDFFTFWGHTLLERVKRHLLNEEDDALATAKRIDV